LTANHVDAVAEYRPEIGLKVLRLNGGLNMI
jgi:hypothetical protein